MAGSKEKKSTDKIPKIIRSSKDPKMSSFLKNLDKTAKKAIDEVRK